MSLGIAIKGPEGLVLAADSRVTLEARQGNNPPITVNYDNATKLLTFARPNTFVGAITYGAATISQRTAHSYLPEFELSLRQADGTPGERLGVYDLARRLSDFMAAQWRAAGMPESGPRMSFLVAGFNADEPYGRVYLFGIPDSPEPEDQSAGKTTFGITYGGQSAIAARLIQGFDPTLLQILAERFSLSQPEAEQLAADLRRRLSFPIPYSALPLQDCVNLATYLIRSTIVHQSVAIGLRGVGGPIDVAVITRTDGLRFVQRKLVHGEGAIASRGGGFADVDE